MSSRTAWGITPLMETWISAVGRLPNHDQKSTAGLDVVGSQVVAQVSCRLSFLKSLTIVPTPSSSCKHNKPQQPIKNRFYWLVVKDSHRYNSMVANQGSQDSCLHLSTLSDMPQMLSRSHPWELPASPLPKPRQGELIAVVF